MTSFHPDTLPSFRKCPLRVAITVALLDAGPLPVAQIADIVGAEPRRVRWALHGRRPSYRHEFALVRLRIAKPSGRAWNSPYQITDEGRTALKLLLPALRRQRR